VADLVREIEAEAAAERERTGIEPPGPAAIRAQKPHDRPAVWVPAYSPGNYWAGLSLAASGKIARYSEMA